MRAAFFVLFLSALAVFGEIIPATNRIDWAVVAGVEGGIRIRDTIYTNLDNDVDLAAFNSAANLCPSNQVVMLTNKTFTLAGVVDLLNINQGVTIRGHGASTLIECEGFVMGKDLSKGVINLHSGYTSGSSNLVVIHSTNNIGIGSSILVNQLNDTAYVQPDGYETDTPLPCTYCDDPDGGTRVRGQFVRLVDIIDGTNYVVQPPLYGPSYTAGLSPRIMYTRPLDPPGIIGQAVFIGIESLRITNTAGTSCVIADQLQNCWFTNVTFEISGAAQSAIKPGFSHRVAIVGCHFRGWNSLASAFVPYVNNSGHFVYNNIFERCYQSIIPVGRASGNVYAYNFDVDITNSTTALIATMGPHGAHVEFELWEGNKTIRWIADSIHGGSSSGTHFRNYYRGRLDRTTFGAGCIWLDSWSLHYNVVGNVLGYPGMTDWTYDIEAPAVGDFSTELYIYRYDYSGYNDPPDAFPPAKAKTLRHGNYIYGQDDTEWDAGIADHTIPDSMFFTSKPGEFGYLPYPSIGPDATGLYTNMIPAEYRYYFGTNPPASVTAQSFGSIGLNLKLRR